MDLISHIDLLTLDVIRLPFDIIGFTFICTLQIYVTIIRCAIFTFIYRHTVLYFHQFLFEFLYMSGWAYETMASSRQDTITSWWRHQMETFSALLALCAGNSPVTGKFPHKGQCGGALMFSLICAWTHGWVNNRKASEFDVPKLISLNLEMIEVYDLLFITNIFEYDLSWFPCL